jgi:hypothetical protein
MSSGEVMLMQTRRERVASEIEQHLLDQFWNEAVDEHLDLLENLKEHDTSAYQQIHDLIPRGTKYLTLGQDAMLGLLPDKRTVVRLTLFPTHTQEGFTGYNVPIQSYKIPGEYGPYYLEFLKRARQYRQPKYGQTEPPPDPHAHPDYPDLTKEEVLQYQKTLEAQAKKEGYSLRDWGYSKLNNIGEVEGQPKILDKGVPSKKPN